MFEYGTYGMIGISIATLSFLAAIFFLGWAIRGIFHQKVAPTGQQMPGDDTGVSREVEELRAELDRRKALANFGSKIAHKLLGAARKGFQTSVPAIFQWTAEVVGRIARKNRWALLEISEDDAPDSIEERFVEILKEKLASVGVRIDVRDGEDPSIYAVADALEVAVRSRLLQKLIIFVDARGAGGSLVSAMRELLVILQYEYGEGIISLVVLTDGARTDMSGDLWYFLEDIAHIKEDEK